MPGTGPPSTTGTNRSIDDALIPSFRGEGPATEPLSQNTDTTSTSLIPDSTQEESAITLSKALRSHSKPISPEEMQQLGLAHSLMEVAYPDKTTIYYFMIPDPDGYILQPVENGSTNNEFALSNPEHPATKEQKDIEMAVRSPSNGNRRFIKNERVKAKRGITIFRSDPNADFPASVRLIQFRDHQQMYDVIHSTRVRGEYVNGSYVKD